MKHWSGKDFEYRGYLVKNDKKDGFLVVYDSGVTTYLELIVSDMVVLVK